tara:strand:- start:1018 stop:2196 length:1179 start_codon:yes stop_codon:yes gene_type:complete
MNTIKWDLVVLDETHHAAAATYMPFIQKLRANTKRVLGFTGTLCRTDVNEIVSSNTRAAQMEKHFDFIGPVLFSRTCLELEKEGLIAKVRRMEIQINMTSNFKAAAQVVSNPSTKKYVESLHPEKLNALWMLVTMHTKMGDVGMVFVNHLLHAKTIQELLGNKWEVLSGSNAHGEDGNHSTEANAEIVARFNEGKLSGIVSTPVGESALDAVNPDFRYAIVIDAHSGPASASQKLGRLSRTNRLSPIPEETATAYRNRRLAAQKQASYYEIVTLETEEMTAAANRRKQFEHEVCSIEPTFPVFFEMFARAGLRPSFNAILGCARAVRIVRSRQQPKRRRRAPVCERNQPSAAVARSAQVHRPGRRGQGRRRASARAPDAAPKGRQVGGQEEQ